MVEFEDELGRIKQEALDARKRLLALASEEGERAKTDALAEAQAEAEERTAVARRDAERESASIIAKGDESLKGLKDHLSERKDEAVELVMKRLLGD